MPKIRFQAKLAAIGSQTILRVPKAASHKLPSRGLSMVEGTLNGHAFQTPLEPDGMEGHWFRVSSTMLTAARAQVGDSVSVALEPMAQWPEPKVPADLAEAFASDPEARRLWMDTTPLARWDWIRWIGATRNRDRRKKKASCDPFGIPSTSHWTGAAIIVQCPRTKSCFVTWSRTSTRPMPSSLAE